MKGMKDMKKEDMKKMKKIKAAIDSWGDGSPWLRGSAANCNKGVRRDHGGCRARTAEGHAVCKKKRVGKPTRSRVSGLKDLGRRHALFMPFTSSFMPFMSRS